MEVMRLPVYLWADLENYIVAFRIIYHFLYVRHVICRRASNLVHLTDDFVADLFILLDLLVAVLAL